MRTKRNHHGRHLTVAFIGCAGDIFKSPACDPRTTSSNFSAPNHFVGFGFHSPVFFFKGGFLFGFWVRVFLFIHWIS
ncbi:unnamed protein product [Citrullus colocynthis]|uniref:Uncharacterized protein n=1 Tax=Citrullus colocynthis TaxID=252529 RepID=A0ABP0YXW8_9ROSI